VPHRAASSTAIAAAERSLPTRTDVAPSVQTEADLAFAGLSYLLASLLDGLAELPMPQIRAGVGARARAAVGWAPIQVLSVTLKIPHMPCPRAHLRTPVR
jgi:hypothetical protein